MLLELKEQGEGPFGREGNPRKREVDEDKKALSWWGKPVKSSMNSLVLELGGETNSSDTSEGLHLDLLSRRGPSSRMGPLTERLTATPGSGHLHFDQSPVRRLVSWLGREHRSADLLVLRLSDP